MFGRLCFGLLTFLALSLPAAAQFGAPPPTPASPTELYADRAYAEASRLSAGVGGEVITKEALFDLERSQQRFDEARQYYQAACDDRSQPTDQWTRNCYKVAEMYRRGIGSTQDYRLARKLYLDACRDGDHVDACLQQAHLSHVGRDTREAPQNYELARELYTRACDLGDPSGCAGLGNMLYRGQGGEQDRTRGSRLLQRACADDYDWACERLQAFGLPETLEKF